ncbi:NAD(P)H-binding protein [Nonomuraea basaltis]|uniref:NAD(P)H-binding protein n=1 Tax=Nonomuraea basaltis TaxID=2495887 RepID=UPI00110C5465|nr:NAD(P)H-binding protein [Nonomuraea basaltis]TMR89172.1 NAD-dependent epimerase/dehydratase family protein [Nonomuraea basaltis]
MKVILFGATGMVGRGVLRECLLDDRVTAVLAVGRAPTGIEHGKLREITHGDLLDLTPIEEELAGYDACFFCLGVSSAGMSEKDYRRITYDYTMSVANTLARLSPDSTFVYVSGVGTDAQGRAMWARVKGATENALLALPLQAYMFRPGYIQPMHGITSRTRLYRLAYVVVRPLYPVLRRLFPSAVTTTERIGQAMITVAERGAPKRILGPSDINAL